MNNRDIKFLHAFNTIPGVGPATLRTLKDFFGSFEAAWIADAGALNQALSSEVRAEKIIAWKKPSLNPDREMEHLIREKISIVPEDDPMYPPYLKEIARAPVILYLRGILPQHPMLAIVGTRRPTMYGKEIAEEFTRSCVKHGLAIASGLALGIDTVAHTTTLDIKGKTVAVLGSGIDQESIFPPENQFLARKIVESGGAVISEYAPKTPAVKEHFPQRNRIISGISRGVLVVEARERSGANITAQFALEQNREVFAIPGSIFSPTSRGPHLLIQQGAKLVMKPENILEELGLEYTHETGPRPHAVFDEIEQIVISLLEEPLSLDMIKNRSGLDTPAINTALSRLELTGVIKNLGQDVYQKIS